MGWVNTIRRATRESPTWLVVGDKAAVGERCGLDGAALDGGFAATATAARWLDDGVAPNGASGRAFTKDSVHGFDLVFAAPKSVSLLRALTNDVAEKVVAQAHMAAVHAALTYLHQHAGYTRVHNPRTGNKDLQRLPGLVGIAYQHETSRCGDPHLHTHVIVPNRQPRADGQLVALDSKSLHHEAKAAGIIYQAVLRHELHTERGFEWAASMSIPGWPRSPASRRPASRRGRSAQPGCANGRATTSSSSTGNRPPRSWRPRKRPRAPANPNRWRGRNSKSNGAPTRAVCSSTAPRTSTRGARGAPRRCAARRVRAPRWTARAWRAWPRASTRPRSPARTWSSWSARNCPSTRPAIRAPSSKSIVDVVSVRVSAERAAHHREGHEKFTVDAVIAEEERVFEMVDAAANHARLWVRDEDLGDLSADQARAIRNIAVSPFLVQPLQAPAGAGKTHSLKALRAAAHHAHKDVLVLAPTGKAVDEAMRDGAGDRGLTVAKALMLIEDDQLDVDRSTVVVVDEASMVGTPELKKLLSCAAVGQAKMVLVGDCLSARAGQGPRRHVRTALRRPAVVAAPGRSLADAQPRRARRLPGVAVRSRQPPAHGGRLVPRPSTGCTPVTRSRWPPMRCRPTSPPAPTAKTSRSSATSGKSPTRINRRLHDTYTAAETPSVRVARDQEVRVGDLILSRNNDATVDVRPGPHHTRGDRVDQVRNGNRWRVAGIDTARAASPPNASATRPARCSSTNTSASTSLWATRPPCIPPRASRR